MSIPILSPKSVAPTDNLYKFLALFGLALIILSVVIVSLRTSYINDRISAAQVNLATYKALKAKLSEMPTTAASTQMERANRFQDEMEQTEMEFVRKKAEIESGKILLDVGMRDCLVLFFVGLVVSIGGFLLWYYKLQRHHDALLATRVKRRLTQLENADADLKASYESP